MVKAAGQRNRKVGATLMNASSSRSHSIFTLAVESADRNGHVRVGKLNLVDLAGSERQSKAGSTGDRLRESMKINLSLSALGNVISALAEQSPFIPYRDSKLTRILQASLGGNTRTTMVANVGPACIHYDETLSTLRYAQRTKYIKNAPHVNEDPKQAVILAFQEEIARLKKQLQEAEQARLQTTPKLEEAVKEIVIEKPVIVEKKVILEKPTIVEKIVEKIKIVDVSEEEKRRMQERNLEDQRNLRAAFEIEKNAIDLARRKAEEGLRAKELEATLYERHQAELAEKLQQMEAQLLRGNAEIARAKHQQRELKKTQLRLEEQQKMEEQLRRERDQGREARQLLESLVTSKERELQGLSGEVQQLCRRYAEVVDDIEDIQKEFQAEREGLLQDIRSLQVEVKLQQTIINYFVPPEEAARMRSLAQWDELQGDWALPFAHLAGNAPQSMIPRNTFTKRRPNGGHTGGVHSTNPRLRPDTIPDESPSRCEETYSASHISTATTRADGALTKALEFVGKRYFKEYPKLASSPDVEVVGQATGSGLQTRGLSSARHSFSLSLSPTLSPLTGSPCAPEQFPKARGLVMR